MEGHKEYYRPDIDGLRAIAVIFVLATHITHSWLVSGRIGVDVFFVISGYLITGILLRELKKGTYSIVAFYQRRIKRILPVLFISASVYLAISYVYVAEYLKDFCEHVICSLLMIQNIWFMRYKHRYVLNMQQSPLKQYAFINTNWSLGIQQQFYLFWPFILACIFKLSPARKYLIVGIFIMLSYGIVIGLKFYSFEWIDQYYFPFSRYWQIFSGCLLALTQYDQNTQNGSETIGLNFGMNHYQLLANIQQNQATSRKNEFNDQLYTFLNFCMIVYAFFYKKQAFEFTIYVIWTIIVIKNKNTFFNQQILASKPLVFIGKLSYSIYMWHYGIIILIDKQMPILALIVTIIGILTYQVQNMLRNSKSSYVVPSILIYGLILLAITIALWLL